MDKIIQLLVPAYRLCVSNLFKKKLNKDVSIYEISSKVGGV